MPPTPKTSYLGRFSNVNATHAGTCGSATTDIVQLNTFGPVVTIDRLEPVGGATPGIVAGALPPGMAGLACPVTPAGTTVSWVVGTPKATGVYTYTLRVRLSDTTNFDHEVEHTIERPPLPVGAPGFPGMCPLITITPIAADLQDGAQDQAYTQQFNGLNGTAPYVFDVLDGALPPGLSLTSAGLLSGTPTTLGAYAFSVRLVDFYGCTAVTDYTMDVVVGSEVTFGSGDLTGEDTPLIWTEFSLVVGAINTVYRWAKVDLADRSTYYGGFKEARILSAGSIRRALSDWRGNYEAANWSIMVSDTDRLLRGLLAGGESRYLLNKYCLMRMISDAGRRLQLIPRTVAIGLLRDYQPVSPFQFSLTFEDYLALFTGLGSTEKQLPKRKITAVDFPDVPADTRNKPVPAVYGDFSSGQSATGAPVITGDGPHGAFTEDGGWVAGNGNLVSSILAGDWTTITLTAGAGGSGTLSADVPNAEYGIIVTAVDGSGRESDPFPFFTDRANGGSRGSFPTTVNGVTFPKATVDGTQKVTAAWGAVAGAVTYRCYLGYYYYGFKPVQVIATASLTCEFTAGPSWSVAPLETTITPAADVVTWGQFWYYVVRARLADGWTALSAVVFGFSKAYRRPIRIQWLTVTGALEYQVLRRGPGAAPFDRQWSVSTGQVDVNGIPYFDDDLLDTGVTYIDGADVDTGAIPVTYVGTRVDLGGFTWMAFLVCGHAIKEITQVFQGGVLVDAGNFGVTFAVPGKTNYATYFSDSGACQYRDINGRRYTLLYARGPQGDAAKDGSKPITLNLKGAETVGNSSGTVITDAFDAQLHAYRNWIFGDYQGGNWPASGPVWPNSSPAVQVIDDASFATAKAVCALRIPGGYTAGFVLGAGGEFAGTREWIRRFNLSCACWTGFNRKSQWFVRVMDEGQTPLTSAQSFTDVRDVFGAPDIHDAPNDMENNVIYSFARRWAKGTWAVENQSAQDALSITNSGQEKKSETIEMWLAKDATMASDVAQRRLMLMKQAPRTVSFTVGLRGMSVELGDLVKLTTAQGVGANGWTDRAIFITRHELNPDKLTVRLEGIDVDRINGASFILGDETVLPASWPSATTAQRKYAYLADETTELFSDGQPGKRLR